MQGQIPFSGLQYVGCPKLEIAFLSCFFGATVLRKGTGYLVVFQIFNITPRGGGPISKDIDFSPLGVDIEH